MGRWEPNAAGRLQQAAWELFLERGYEQTTTAEIAKRAGLSERTFFRHFADKREVFFANGGLLADAVMRALDEVPASTCAFDAVRHAIEAAATILTHRDFSRRRQELVNANPELQERERIKLAGIAAGLAEGLRKRGVSEMPANLAAEMGISVFRLAFERWLEPHEPRDFIELVREGFREVKLVTAAS
jgi:AcrR family transcriptional regulator